MNAINNALRRLGETASTIHKAVTEPVVLTLAKAWIGIGLIRPARTQEESFNTDPKFRPKLRTINSPERISDRWDYTELWHMQLGKYLMPQSQTFTLRAKKRVNISSLVDGPDIIQQTRKESKTIDCSIRMATREGKGNLNMLKERDATNSTASQDSAVPSDIGKLADFLQELYENDTIFRVWNNEINNTFKVEYVFMTEYKFTPRVGMGTFTFEFTLMEVLYGENVVTFNLRETESTVETPRQITD